MALKRRRKFTREFKLQVLAEITSGKSIAQAARERKARKYNYTHKKNPTYWTATKDEEFEKLRVSNILSCQVVQFTLCRTNGGSFLDAALRTQKTQK